MKAEASLSHLALSVIMLTFLFPATSLADEVKVLEQAGVSSSSYKETTVVFETNPGAKVDVFFLLAQSSVYVSGSGGSASGSGVETKFLCTAPAKVIMPGGVHNLFVGNAFLGTNLRIAAQGGTQYWHVKNGDIGGFLGSMLLALGGVGVSAAGFISGDTGLGIAGIAGFVGGLVWGLNSGSDAHFERLEH